MTIREKIAMRVKMPRDEDIIDKEIRRAFLRILCGGTVIGLITEGGTFMTYNVID